MEFDCMIILNKLKESLSKIKDKIIEFTEINRN